MSGKQTFENSSVPGEPAVDQRELDDKDFIELMPGDKERGVFAVKIPRELYESIPEEEREAFKNSVQKQFSKNIEYVEADGVEVDFSLDDKEFLENYGATKEYFSKNLDPQDKDAKVYFQDVEIKK